MGKLLIRLLLAALAAMVWQDNRAMAQGAPSPQALSPASANALGPGFSDHNATVHGIRLHYVAGGHGPAVILVPGWPETWWAWRKLMPGLAQRFTVIAVDTPGMGESSQPTSGYDMASGSDDPRDLM